jgi:hypothetical protein
MPIVTFCAVAHRKRDCGALSAVAAKPSAPGAMAATKRSSVEFQWRLTPAPSALSVAAVTKTKKAASEGSLFVWSVLMLCRDQSALMAAESRLF